MKNRKDFIMIELNGKDDDVVISKYVDNPVWHKLFYIPPYSDFNLKDIQLAVRAKDIFEQTTIVLAIDVTEWLGHESEEYFVNTLKFLYDHKGKWNYIFLVHNENEKAIKQMYITIRMYMKGDLIVEKQWYDENTLAMYLEKKHFLNNVVAKFLAKLLYSGNFDKWLNEQFIEEILDECIDILGKEKISLNDFISYISKESSIVYMIDPIAVDKMLFIEKEKEY